MIERARRLGLLLEAAQSFCIGSEGGRENFDGHVATELRIASAIHDTHPALANLRADFVAAQLCASGNSHQFLFQFKSLREADAPQPICLTERPSASPPSARRPNWSRVEKLLGRHHAIFFEYHSILHHELHVAQRVNVRKWIA